VVVPYKPENPKNREVYVLSEIDDLFAALDEYLAIYLENIFSSADIKTKLKDENV